MEVSSQVGNILTFVLVMITGIYVYFTWKIAQSNSLMLELMAEQNRQSFRPYVSARLVFREQMVAQLLIKNGGKTAATTLSITLDRDFYKFAQKSDQNNLRNFSVFKEPIEIFPSDSELLFDLSQGFNFDKIVDVTNLAAYPLYIRNRLKSSTAR